MEISQMSVMRTANLHERLFDELFFHCDVLFTIQLRCYGNRSASSVTHGNSNGLLWAKLLAHLSLDY